MPHQIPDVGGPAQPLLSVRGLVKHFPLKKDVFGRGGGVVSIVVAEESRRLGQRPQRAVETAVVARALVARHGLSGGAVADGLDGRRGLGLGLGF